MSTENNKKLDADSNLIKQAINLSTVFIQYNPELLPQVFTKEMLEVCMEKELKSMKKYFSEYVDMKAELLHSTLTNEEKIFLLGDMEAYLKDIAFIYKLYKIYEAAINEKTKAKEDEEVTKIEQVLIAAGLIEEKIKDSSNNSILKR